MSEMAMSIAAMACNIPKMTLNAAEIALGFAYPVVPD